MTTRACAHALCLPYGGCQFDSDVHTDAHGNLIDTCGHCQFLPTTSGSPARAVQAGCPVHSGRDSTVPRRVRTQVERDADGTTWRHHEHGERISDGASDRPLPPVPDCCYPPDAVDLPAPRRRWWHRYTRRNP